MNKETIFSPYFQVATMAKETAATRDLSSVDDEALELQAGIYRAAQIASKNSKGNTSDSQDTCQE
jgi:hypothetical protein